MQPFGGSCEHYAMHDFHTKTSSVEDVSSGVDDFHHTPDRVALAVQVERHSSRRVRETRYPPQAKQPIKK